MQAEKMPTRMPTVRAGFDAAGVGVEVAEVVVGLAVVAVVGVPRGVPEPVVVPTPAAGDAEMVAADDEGGKEGGEVGEVGEVGDVVDMVVVVVVAVSRASR